LASGAARLIGNRQPLPERVAILHLTDCELPCWIGIVPGKTTIGAAKERIRQVYGREFQYEIKEDRPGTIWIINKPHNLSLHIVANISSSEVTNETMVETLYFSLVDGNRLFATQTPSLGELYSLLGHPEFIGFAPEGGGTFPVLVYPNYRTELY